MLTARVASIVLASSLIVTAISPSLAQSPMEKLKFVSDAPFAAQTTSDDGLDHGHSSMETEGAPASDEMRSGMMDGANMNMMTPGMIQLALMAAMDSDNDGAVSLEEFQAMHERMFGYLDADGDELVTVEEMRRTIEGMRDRMNK